MPERRSVSGLTRHLIALPWPQKGISGRGIGCMGCSNPMALDKSHISGGRRRGKVSVVITVTIIVAVVVVVVVDLRRRT